VTTSPPATPARPDIPEVADVRQVSRTGQPLRTRLAGIFLFLPLLARLRFNELVEAAGYSGSAMIPATSAWLTLLSLKLLDKERRSHVNDFNFDEALGLFAGLNILPKKSYLAAYSYSTIRDNQQRLLCGWIKALSALLFPEGKTFSVDFHPIPYRGEAAGLENHYIPLRGQAQPSVLSCFAVENDSRVLCYANADLTRAEQAGEALRFVEYWHTVTGSNPDWLYLDGRVTDYAGLNQLNQRDIWFITIRRRGAAILRRLRTLPARDWHTAIIDTPQRCHQRIRYVDEQVRLRGYTGTARQVAVTGLGRAEPTLFLTNHPEETARNLVIRYAGRNRIEDGLGQAVNFFHLNCLASEVALNVDVDCAATVLAQGCYRWLARQLRGFEKVQVKQLYRCFVENSGVVQPEQDRLVVHFDKRSHNPILHEAGLDREPIPIPWLHNRSIVFVYS
jgi:hypothetical protein